MHRLARVAVSALVLTLAACAATPQKGTGRPSSAKGPDSAADALYQRLDENSRRYSAGLDLARNGDTVGAQRAIKAALDDLRAAAAQCERVQHCNQQRFVAGMDTLLRQGIGGPATGAIEGEGDTPEATSELGESTPVTAALPELGRSVALLKGRELGDIIALNGPVKAALEQWLTQYRPNLMLAYENYEYMRFQMAPEYHKAGLPEALLFGMMAKESGGKVHAVSRSGASGPLQFMYATGQRFGLTTVDGFDQRFDPRMSTRANAAYINEQLAIFNNNLELVVGAYNGGEGAMRRRVAAAGGTVSFWDPKIYYDVSQETREYVPMVLAAAWLFLHPERYNLKFPTIPGHGGSITLKRPASIAELTICLGQDGGMPNGWFRTLRNLNPQLDPQAQEPAGAKLTVPQQLEKVYARDCAGGRWPELAAELHAAVVPAPPPVALAQKATPAAARRPAAPQSRNYVVRKGDSVASIARSTRCGKAPDIGRANALRAPHFPIKPGQVLKLTNCPR